MLIELPQEKLLRKHGYTLAAFEQLKKRVRRFQKNHTMNVRRFPGHIRAKFELMEAVYGLGK